MENTLVKYTIKLYPKAYRDISYITSEISEPEIAKRQTNRIWDAIESLGAFPFSHQDRLVGRYSNKGYKQLLIDNYIVIYKINEIEKIVYIVTVQYAGRNL